MNKALTFALASLVIMSCNTGNKAGADDSRDTLTADTVVKAEEVKYPELTEQRCKDLLNAVPEHGNLNSPETTLSAEYYDTWRQAWDMPDGGLGGIGNNEFLSYFICGNDPCPSHTAEIKTMDVDGDKATVTFHINHPLYPSDKTLHTFKLVVENNRWVIANYDNTLEEMKEYIRTQPQYLRSAEFRNYADEILNGSDADEEYKDIVRKELAAIEKYLNEHDQ